MRKSISKKIVAIVATSLFITLSITLLVLVFNQRSSTINTVEEESENLSHVIVNSISFSMAQGLTDVSPYIEKLKTTKNLAELRITPTDKIKAGSESKMDKDELAALNSRKSNSFTESFKDISVIRIIEPILSDETCNSCHSTSTGEPLAIVSVRHSMEETYSVLASQRWVAIILALAAISFTVIVSFFFIN